MIRTILILLSFLLYGQIGTAQDIRLKGIEGDIDRLMDTFNTVGISVIVVNRDKVIYSEEFGYRDLEMQKPVTQNTVFGIGSISKQFMCGLIGVYEGLDSLTVQDRPVQYITGLDFSDDLLDSLVSIEDLMTHQSSLGNYDAPMVFFPTENLVKNAQRLQYLEPQTDITGTWRYSNMGYSLLGAIVEQLGVKPWGELMKLTYSILWA